MKLHFFSKIDENLTQYITEASIKDDTLSFYEEINDQKNLVNLFIKNDKIILIRDGDVYSKFEFIQNKITKAEYKNIYGNMQFDIQTLALEVTKDKIFIQYNTIFDEKTSSKVKLWFILKENA